MQPKVGGKYHLKLNNGERPIANKYREGKMKRTLKRELKVREIVKRETLETSILAVGSVLYLWVWGCSSYVPVNISLFLEEKAWGKVAIVFGRWCYRLWGHTLGQTEDCSGILGDACRHGARVTRQHADYRLFVPVPGRFFPLSLRMLTKWF